MSYTVYILKSMKDGNFYTGFTNNIDRRLMEHNMGQVKTTRSRIPLVLVHSEIFETREKARAREKFLKTGTGREFRDSILK